jgi:hypothetical protein
MPIDKMSATALFIIDIQNDNATDPATRIRAAGRIREAGDAILKKARDIADDHRATNPASQPPLLLIFVQHEDLPGCGSLKRDAEAWKLVFEPRVGVEVEMLIQKTTRE